MSRSEEIVVTGVGVTSAIGQRKGPFEEALFAASHRFDVMVRPGRQHESQFVGAEISAFVPTTRLDAHALWSASLTAQVALTTLEEAWNDAALDQVDGERIGLVVGGSNVQQREIVLAHDRLRTKPKFVRPSYGLSFMDTDICGLCTSAFGIRGFAHTVGGASASGQLAIIEAAEAVASGRVDVCIAIGALMDISYWECQALQSMGAMISDAWALRAPAEACRPFDAKRRGFVYGESCAALVIERRGARPTHAAPYGVLAGWAVHVDGNRNPNPSVEGEVRAIRRALARADVSPAEIDYVNTHGTASVLGDETELQALRACELTHAFVNATKSITGHGLTAAGAVEAVATLLQMRRNALHPTRNLDEPMDSGFPWVTREPVAAELRSCLSLSMGFGGINTALCLRKSDSKGN